MPSRPLISIVDDDASLRIALVRLVRSLGYRAHGYGSAEEFLGAADGATSDCIVTDIHLPGLSGIALKNRLSEQGHPAPVIMITARVDSGLDEKAMASGAVCLLHKPFAAEALNRCLERALAL